MGTTQLAVAPSPRPDKTPEFSGPPTDHPTDPESDLEILRSIPKQFSIENADDANWVVRKIAEARAYADRVRLFADREVARAAREERVMMFLFGRQLERWGKSEVLKLNGRRKSVPLPAGTLSFRTVGVRLVIDDEKTVISWARENLPEAVVTVEKLLKSVVSEHMEKSGVIPDSGVHVEPGGERFSIR